jgi:hypothetical protein
MLPVGRSQIIQNPAKGKQSEQKLMDGVIHSGVLNQFQQHGLDGILQGGMTKKQEAEHKKDVRARGKEPLTHKVKASATKMDIGYVHYPGSKH